MLYIHFHSSQSIFWFYFWFIVSQIGPSGVSYFSHVHEFPIFFFSVFNSNFIQSWLENISLPVQLLSWVELFSAPGTAARQASMSITNFQNLLKLMSIKSAMPSNHLILCRPLLLLISIFLSIRIFPNESVLCIRWPKDWSFGFSISPSNEYSELTFFRIDWFDLLAIQRTLKSLLQHRSSKASILQHLAFSMVQLVG